MSRWWYLACVVPPLISSVAIIALTTSTVDSVRMPVPGTRTVSLAHGDYAIDAVDARDPSAVQCTVRDARGTDLPLERRSTVKPIKTKRHTYHKIYDLKPAAGEYTMSCQGAGTPEVSLARRLGARFALVNAALSVGGALGGIAVGFLVYRRRKRRLATG